MSTEPGGQVDRQPLVVVRVEDAITSVLAGHDGCRYESAPQPRSQALELVCLLLGSSERPRDGQTRWRYPIAGGTRTVSLDPVEITSDGGHNARVASDPSFAGH
jgi:hypothetical protein